MRFLSPLLATLLTPLIVILPLTGQELTPASAAHGTALQLRVITSGEVVGVEAGVQSAGPVTVEVKDDSGAPVAEAAVIFRLPESGPSGTFAGGALTSVVYTDASGRAKAGSIQWGATAGVVPVRITAAKGTGHAGLLFSENLTGPAGAAQPVTKAVTPALPLAKIPVSMPASAPVPVQPRPGVLARGDANSPSVVVEHLGTRSARARKPQPADDDEAAPQPGSSPVAGAAAYSDDESPDANVPIRHASLRQDDGDSQDSPGVSVTRAGAAEQSAGGGHHIKRWLVIAGVIAGAGAGLALVHKGSNSTASSGTSIGAPSISIGHP